jgi:hypothetical protein
LNDIGRGCLGAIGGLAAAVVLTVIWGIFLLVAVYSFAFALGSTETLGIGGIAFFVSATVALIFHLGATTLLLRAIGSRWLVSAVASLAGNILAGAVTAATIALILTVDGGLPQSFFNSIALLLVLSAGFPVALSMVIGRPVAWPAVVAVAILTTTLGGTVLLFRTIYLPALIVLFAWIAIPAVGGLLGGGPAPASRSLSHTTSP